MIDIIFFYFRNVKSERMLLQPKENSTAVASHLFSIRSSPIGLSATVPFTGKSIFSSKFLRWMTFAKKLSEFEISNNY